MEGNIQLFTLFYILRPRFFSLSAVPFDSCILYLYGNVTLCLFLLFTAVFFSCGRRLSVQRSEIQRTRSVCEYGTPSRLSPSYSFNTLGSGLEKVEKGTDKIYIYFFPSSSLTLSSLLSLNWASLSLSLSLFLHIIIIITIQSQYMV